MIGLRRYDIEMVRRVVGSCSHFVATSNCWGPKDQLLINFSIGHTRIMLGSKGKRIEGDGLPALRQPMVQRQKMAEK